LLVGSDIRVVDVARESGYQSLALFNAMFKKRFGLTPSEYRQQNL
jgi:two-component system response regulator YesN